MGIKLMNSAAPLGHEKMVIKTSDPSGGHLRLFPGSNQVVLTSIGTQGDPVSEYLAYKSVDSGETFNPLPESFPIVIMGSEINMAVSFNNRYYYVGDPSTIDGSSYIAQSKDGGNTWEYKRPSTTDTRRFVSVSSSRDGKYALASNGVYNDNGDAYLTRDFGETWTAPVSPSQFHKTFVDPEGQNMLIGGFTVTYYSNDYGNNWSLFSQPLTALGEVMVSGDGNYKVVFEQYESTGGARVYISTDWTNWDSTNLSVRLIGGSISNDGKYMLIAASDGYNSPETKVNLSSDYGQTWNQINFGAGSGYWSGTAMSSDGKYMIAIPGFQVSGNVYKSIDYGQTWSIESGIPSGIYNNVKMSKSGRYVYLAGRERGILVSKDYMNSWDQQYDPSSGLGVFINF